MTIKTPHAYIGLHVYYKEPIKGPSLLPEYTYKGQVVCQREFIENEVQKTRVSVVKHENGKNKEDLFIINNDTVFTKEQTDYPEKDMIHFTDSAGLTYEYTWLDVDSLNANSSSINFYPPQPEEQIDKSIKELKEDIIKSIENAKLSELALHISKTIEQHNKEDKVIPFIVMQEVARVLKACAWHLDPLKK